MKVQRLFAPGVIAVALSLFATTAVSAHARYKSSTPSQGEVVSAPPSRVEITFSQDIQKIAGTYGINVSIEGGPPVIAGNASVNDAARDQLTVDLQPNLGPGRYVVRWKNVSDDDGDPAEGAFSFYLDVQPTAANIASDKDLEAIGAEEEIPGATTGAGTVAAVPSAGASAAGTPTTTAPAKSEGGSNTGVYVVIGVIVVVVIVAGGGWYAMSRRSA